MIEILNLNCKENQGWRVEKEKKDNKKFEAFWVNIGGKELYVPVSKDSIEDLLKINDNVFLKNEGVIRFNQFDATKNSKGVTMIRSNNNCSWDKAVLIAFHTPNGEEIKNIEIKDNSNNLLDVLYFHCSEDKTSLAMVVSVPSLISVKNIARDNSIVIHYGDIQNNKIAAHVILPYYLHDDLCLTQCFVSKVNPLKTQRKMEYTKSFRQKVLVVPDSFTYEKICEIKKERNLLFVKALHYSEVEKYIRENKCSLYDMIFLKDNDLANSDEGKTVYKNMITTISNVIKETNKNIRMYVSRDNNRYVMWRIK